MTEAELKAIWSKNGRRVVVVENGTERTVRIGGREVKLKAVPRSKVGGAHGDCVVVQNNGERFVQIGEDVVKVVTAPKPKSREARYNDWLKALDKRAERICDHLDARKYSVSVQTIRKYRKMRLEGKEPPPLNPCQYCGRETANRPRRERIDWHARVYTCEECQKLVPIIDHMLDYYEMRGDPGWGYYVAPEDIEQAIHDWNNNLVYIDNAGNYRYKEKGKRYVVPWNKAAKRAFRDHENFAAYAYQHRGGRLNYARRVCQAC